MTKFSFPERASEIFDILVYQERVYFLLYYTCYKNGIGKINNKLKI